MPGEQDFDMGAAVAEVSSGLGFGDSSGEGNDDSSNDSPALEVGSGESPPAGEGEQGAGTDPAAPTEKPAESVEANAEAKPAAAPEPGSAPSTWREPAKAKWVALDPEVKAEILKREDDFFRGIDGYKADASIGKNLKQVMDPFMPILEQYGLNPYSQIQSLMQAHQKLALGSPAEKLAFYQKLAVDYGIDAGVPAAEAGYVDPEVNNLRQKTDALQSTVQAVTAQLTQQRQAEVRTAIDKFAADPANIHFAEVSSDMAILLKTGASPTLEDAYQKAIWQNPVTRTKEVARQQAETAAAEGKKNAERVAAAKKAAVAVPRAVGQGRSTAPLGTMDDTLEATLASIKARER